jgi:hypothetical protein
VTATFNSVNTLPYRIVTPANEDTPPPELIPFVRERLGFEPDAQQLELLKANPKRCILNCSRQWGKSSVAAAVAVHRAYSRPNSLIVMAAPVIRQAGEFIQKAEMFVRRLGIRPQGDGVNLCIQFPMVRALWGCRALRRRCAVSRRSRC